MPEGYVDTDAEGRTRFSIATYNTGAFDGGNPDIRFSIAGDKNIDNALTGVTPDSLANAIEDIIVNAKIDIRGTEGEKLATKIAATEFFRKYSRMKIPLSTGVFMFFAPDARAVIRYNGDRNLAWAEYTIHQVTNNHNDGNGKKYRSYNKGKVEVVNPLLDKIVQEDNAEISARGNVLFYSQIDDARYAKVIASPTEEGNYRADLTNVSSVLEQGKMPAKLNPLGAAIGTDGLGGVFTSAPTSLAIGHNISQSAPAGNGGTPFSLRSAMPEGYVDTDAEGRTRFSIATYNKADLQFKS